MQRVKEISFFALLSYKVLMVHEKEGGVMVYKAEPPFLSSPVTAFPSSSLTALPD